MTQESKLISFSNGKVYRLYDSGDVVETKTARQGSIISINGQQYILARVGYRTFAAINIEDGNRYTSPVKDEIHTRSDSFSKEVMSILTGGSDWRLEKW